MSIVCKIVQIRALLRGGGGPLNLGPAMAAAVLGELAESSRSDVARDAALALRADERRALIDPPGSIPLRVDAGRAFERAAPSLSAGRLAGSGARILALAEKENSALERDLDRAIQINGLGAFLRQGN